MKLTQSNTRNPMSNIRNAFHDFKAVISRKSFVFLKTIILFLPIFFGRMKSAFAAAKTNIKGIDLYGRMPLDDWLFDSWTLTDPNLLKSSIVEAVIVEFSILYICLNAYLNFTDRSITNYPTSFRTSKRVLGNEIYLFMV